MPRVDLDGAMYTSQEASSTSWRAGRAAIVPAAHSCSPAPARRSSVSPGSTTAVEGCGAGDVAGDRRRVRRYGVRRTPSCRAGSTPRWPRALHWDKFIERNMPRTPSAEGSGDDFRHRGVPRQPRRELRHRRHHHDRRRYYIPDARSGRDPRRHGSAAGCHWWSRRPGRGLDTPGLSCRRGGRSGRGGARGCRARRGACGRGGAASSGAGPTGERADGEAGQPPSPSIQKWLAVTMTQNNVANGSATRPAARRQRRRSNGDTSRTRATTSIIRCRMLGIAVHWLEMSCIVSESTIMVCCIGERVDVPDVLLGAAQVVLDDIACCIRRTARRAGRGGINGNRATRRWPAPSRSPGCCARPGTSSAASRTAGRTRRA